MSDNDLDEYIEKNLIIGINDIFDKYITIEDKEDSVKEKEEKIMADKKIVFTSPLPTDITEKSVKINEQLYNDIETAIKNGEFSTFINNGNYKGRINNLYRFLNLTEGGVYNESNNLLNYNKNNKNNIDSLNIDIIRKEVLEDKKRIQYLQIYKFTKKIVTRSKLNILNGYPKGDFDKAIFLKTIKEVVNDLYYILNVDDDFTVMRIGMENISQSGKDNTIERCKTNLELFKKYFDSQNNTKPLLIPKDIIFFLENLTVLIKGFGFKNDRIIKLDKIIDHDFGWKKEHVQNVISALEESQTGGKRRKRRKTRRRRKSRGGRKSRRKVAKKSRKTRRSRRRSRRRR